MDYCSERDRQEGAFSNLLVTIFLFDHMMFEHACSKRVFLL